MRFLDVFLNASSISAHNGMRLAAEQRSSHGIARLFVNGQISAHNARTQRAVNWSQKRWGEDRLRAEFDARYLEVYARCQ